MAIDTAITKGSYVDKRGLIWETLSTPSFQFRLMFRKLELPTARDKGATLEVYGQHNGEWTEVLKFDCFAEGPHWHRCYPDKPDLVTQLEPQGYDAAIDFAKAQLEGQFVSLVAEQGYPDRTTPEKLTEVVTALPAVEGRLREMARDEGPMQVMRAAM